MSLHVNRKSNESRELSSIIANSNKPEPPLEKLSTLFHLDSLQKTIFPIQCTYIHSSTTKFTFIYIHPTRNTPITPILFSLFTTKFSQLSMADTIS